MRRSGNLGIRMEGSGGGADLKQKGNLNRHSIVFTRSVIAKEKISTI